MLYALINGEKRSPSRKGERATCPDCLGELSAVIPTINVRHWRHKAGDCDNWSEPEGQWHLQWKEEFALGCREICMIDPDNGERHRADIVVEAGTSLETVLELQHSSISEDERLSRENFYSKNRRMFWLVHLHNETSFNATTFYLSLGLSKPYTIQGKEFRIAHWASRSNQFIEKWKRSKVYVFFDWNGEIFFLANNAVLSTVIGSDNTKGKFAVCHLSKKDFLNAVHGFKS